MGNKPTGHVWATAFCRVSRKEHKSGYFCLFLSCSFRTDRGITNSDVSSFAKTCKLGLEREKIWHGAQGSSYLFVRQDLWLAAHCSVYAGMVS